MKKMVDKLLWTGYNKFVASRGKRWFAEVAELADAHGSGPCGSNTLWVRLPSSARNGRDPELKYRASDFLVCGKAHPMK